ncbi:hypothetical protein XCV1777 [Xanthomonas euvesicatoria pv. vesicatoria str. 85-10]|uniref:Uncharacterized protein n=1 Tax=Xanthomonas euvesicatoria pv. vesicatoria (strain 85-10) TaxID=316273 RepID=Q3BUQ5_XANE5|nr:hypothetical protein XCV1777 [Xanthomonas euvesicatoria pv. vesicatoria str. 85-10]
MPPCACRRVVYEGADSARESTALDLSLLQLERCATALQRTIQGIRIKTKTNQSQNRGRRPGVKGLSIFGSRGWQRSY